MTTTANGLDEGLTAIEDALRDLRTTAPASLLPATLAAVGLADLYASLPSAIGDVWVAWSGRGVSTLMGALDATAFEAQGCLALARLGKLRHPPLLPRGSLAATRSPFMIGGLWVPVN